MSDIKKAIANAIVRVVLYLRLSEEDRDKLTKEQKSESIKNQEIMLREYAKEQGWEVVGVYEDEDWSGADATRPHFNEMINECEAGNVDVVLVKTQARFARDMELIEKYVHNLFHQWNVRFVTKIEKIDNTKNETKKTSQLLGLTDQWMLEDTSTNIRETLKSKRKAGQFTGSFSSYGYIKDPENKNHLVIDTVAAEVVKRIYEEYLQGNGLEKIANNLNKDKIPSPLEYKMMNGSKLQIPLLKQYLDYEFIEKAGTYVIRVSLLNTESQVLNNLVSFNMLTTDMQNFNNKCDITLKRYSSDRTKVYYSEKADLDISKFDENDFILLNENDVIPKTATCIATFTKELDRTHLTEYQFEVTLKENVAHEQFYFKVSKYVDNIDVDVEFNTNIRKKLLWSGSTVKDILENEVYIGNLVQFNTTTVSYKNHTIIYNEDEDKIRANDTHNEIIDKATWYTVQERLEANSRSGNNGVVHAFCNKVFCSNCNRVFSKCGKKIGGTDYAYLCCKDKNEKWANCDNKKYLREEDLHNFVLENINNLLDRFYNEDNLNELNAECVEQDLFKDKLDALEKELNSINKELQSKSTYFQRLYEDRASGLLPEKEFLTLMNKYKDDTAKLDERMRIVKKEISSTTARKESLKTRENIFKKYRHIDKLNIEIVNDFIDKVLVGHYDEMTNSRDIKIIWNFAV